MYAQSKGIYYVQVSTDSLPGPFPVRAWVASPALPVPALSPGPSCLPTTVQLEDDIIAKPNYLSTMKNFALQQPGVTGMILSSPRAGFHWCASPPCPTVIQNLSPAHFCLCHQLSAPALFPSPGQALSLSECPL